MGDPTRNWMRYFSQCSYISATFALLKIPQEYVTRASLISRGGSSTSIRTDQISLHRRKTWRRLLEVSCMFPDFVGSMRGSRGSLVIAWRSVLSYFCPSLNHLSSGLGTSFCGAGSTGNATMRVGVRTQPFDSLSALNCQGAVFGEHEQHEIPRCGHSAVW